MKSGEDRQILPAFGRGDSIWTLSGTQLSTRRWTVDVKRQLAVVALGAGVGLTGLSGCQTTPSLRGLAFWNKNDSASVAATTPDVSKQRFDGLSKQLAADQPRAAGQAKPGSAPLGGQRPAENDNFFTSSWKKTTAAVSGAFAAKPKTDETKDDPLRLDNPTKKLGPEVHVAAARLFENQSKFVEAQDHYQKALQVAPKDLSALVGLARLHDRQGNWQKAVELYQQAIKVEPNNSLVYNDLGLCLARQQQHETALQALNKAVALTPGSAKYRNNLATVLEEVGRSDEAFQQLSAGNSPAVAHYNLGYLLQQKGQRAEATQHYQQALAIDPSLAAARDMLVQLGELTGQPASAQALPQLAPPQFGVYSPPQAAPQSMRLPSQDSASAAAYGPTGSASTVPVVSPVVSSPAPQQTATAQSARSNFHIGDDEPAPEVATSRWKWESDWPLAGNQLGAGTVQALPQAR